MFPDGNQKDLICLKGTIPVPYRGAVYNIPVSIWITDNHPYSAPICYVTPTKDMTIKVSKHVDSSGRIYLPYLSDWTANSSDLLGVIQVMIIVFGETPPVYSKPKNVGPVPQSGDTSISGGSVVTPFSSGNQLFFKTFSNKSLMDLILNLFFSSFLLILLILYLNIKIGIPVVYQNPNCKPLTQ